MSELVSVVVPVHNAARFVRATLESVLNQTHRALEVLVVDDGSTDGSGELVEEMAASDSRVRLIRQPNAGVAAARNSAIAEASGPFLAPIDSDDLWHPEKIERQLAAMHAHPGAGMVYAWHVRIDVDDKILGPFDFRPAYTGRVLPMMALQNIAGASVPLLRTELVRSVGAYDTSLRLRGGQGSEDWLLQCLLAAKADVALVPRFLVGYRQVPASMSRNAGAALASHLVAVADLARNHPDLAPAVLRWSETIHALWLAANHNRDGRCDVARTMAWWAFRRQFAGDRAFWMRAPFRRYVTFRLRRSGGRLRPRPTDDLIGRSFPGTDLTAAEISRPFPGEAARYAFMATVAAAEA